MKDKQALKYSSVIYGCLRSFIYGYFFFNIFSNVALYTFLIEIFMVSEFFVMILIFLSLSETIKKLKIEIEVCLMNDKSYIQYILSMISSFSNRFIAALAFQCIYRVIYLTVIINKSLSSNA